jgi:hypothetical protein
MNKYEQLIEFIINEDEAKAKELFHQIVVEKSRDIYESLMDEEIGGNQVEELTQQVQADEEGMQEDEEDFGGEQDFDSEDGMDMDPEAKHDEFGGDEGEGSVEDRVMDLEDALDELKAEFDALMAGEQGEEEFGDEEGDEEEFGAEEGDEEMFEDSEEAEEEDADEEDLEESRQGRKMTEAEWIREYVEKIGEPFPGEQASPSGKMAGTGAKSEKQGEKNTKSPVGPGTDMGGTNKNIARGGANADPSGTPSKEPSGLLKGGGEIDVAKRNVNKPGANTGKTSFKTQEGEYSKESGAEGQTTGGKVPVAKKSLLKHIGK